MAKWNLFGQPVMIATVIIFIARSPRAGAVGRPASVCDRGGKTAAATSVVSIFSSFQSVSNRASRRPVPELFQPHHRGSGGVPIQRGGVAQLVDASSAPPDRCQPWRMRACLLSLASGEDRRSLPSGFARRVAFDPAGGGAFRQQRHRRSCAVDISASVIAANIAFPGGTSPRGAVL